MPRIFRVYTRVQRYFFAYAVKIIKNIYKKNRIFEVGLMVIPVIQPPQPVANCFQLIETTLREYKSPSYAWPKGERKIIDIIPCWSPIQVWFPVPHALPRFLPETLISGRCSSTYMSSRVHKSWKNPSKARARRIQTTVCSKIVEGFWWSLHLSIIVHVVRNEEEPSCFWIHVLISTCICAKIVN